MGCMMQGQSLQGKILRELIVWMAAVAGGYLTFTFFEPLYGHARSAAASLGLRGVLDFEIEGSTVPLPPFTTRLTSNSPLPLRGTFSAGRQPSPAARKVTLTANDYGHFHVFAQIKGQQVEFMTDTGATYVALSYETAHKLGLISNSLRFTGRSTTANGVARVASVMLDSVRIGDITVKDVQAVIAEPGRMTQNLLGMSFIKQLSGFELNGNKLTL